MSENFLIDRLVGDKTHSDARFLLLEDDSDISYQNFFLYVDQVANTLVSRGLEPGDRVALQVSKSWQALAVYLAAVKAGGVFLPLNPAYTPGEIEYFVDNAEPRILVCTPSAEEALSAIARDSGARLMTLGQYGDGSFAEAVNYASAEFVAVKRSGDDLAAILYTSGTTGRSKGTMLSHHNLWSNAEVLCKFWQFTDNDRLLHALPIFHTHGLFVASNITLVAGSSMIFQYGFDVDKVLAKLPQATVMMGVPTFYTRLLDQAGLSQSLVSHMRLFVSGSAPLLVETNVAFEQRTGLRILERYGMTETNMNTSNPYDGDRRAGTVGPALPGIELRVVGENGSVLTAGEIGSVEVRGPNVFDGYWKMPEKTAEEFTEDGYFITGDIGVLSEDGYLTIVGRSKDLIISGGYNIYPKEVELLLDQIEGVDESAVIGVPHPDFGEAVVAVVTGESAPTEAEVKEVITEKIARFKQPKKIFHVNALPRNTMGKVQKNVLRQQYSECFQSRMLLLRLLVET